MLAPEDVTDLLRDHLSRLSAEQFSAELLRWCGALAEDGHEAYDTTLEEGVPMGQLVLFQPQPAPLPLEGYLACALTGLTEDQREQMIYHSSIITDVCREYGIEMYEPRTATDPVEHPDIVDVEVFRKDRERVLRSDVLVVLGNAPSLGVGEELDFAYNALLPTILIWQDSARISRMATGIPSFKLHLTYTDTDDLRQRLTDCLAASRPILESRKVDFAEFDVNVVGNKVFRHRQLLGLSRQDIAESSGGLITEELLQQIESHPDRLSNPSLVQLRRLATILKTTVADLVEPDLNGRLTGLLHEWVSNTGNDAPSLGLSARDSNKLKRRILYRILQLLEED